jgi:eukaryotic-like serine/threonine-protein kinase
MSRETSNVSDRPTVMVNAFATADSSAADPMVGRVLDGKYKILARLGEGGMGAVYRARRVHIGDEVAVKVLHANFVKDTAALERFRREARAAAMLKHPNVVAIYDYGEAREEAAPAFIVMELVAGKSLRDILESDGRLELQRAVALMRSICAGVAAAHRNQIIHRDLKPDNIIVVPPHSDAEPEAAKVLDFGIAKLRDSAGGAGLTQTGVVIGTPYYMSPEQCMAETLDARSDVYSLGAMFYEMLAGAPPFSAATATGVVAKHLTELPPPLPLHAGIPPALEAVIMRALSKDRQGRQGDAAELSRELQPLTGQLQGDSAYPQMAFRGTVPTTAEPPAPRSEGLNYPTPPPSSTPGYPQMSYREAPGQVSAPPPLIVQPKRSRAGLVIGLVALVVIVLAAAGVAFWMLNQQTSEPANQNIARANENRNETAVANRSSLPPASQNANTSPTVIVPPELVADLEAVKEEVTDTLNGWAEALNDHDLDAHMEYFAPTLATYYNAQNVSADKVRADLERAFERYSSFNVELSNIEVTPDPSGLTSTAVFDKTWEFQGEKVSTGSVQQMAWLEKIGSDWQIVGLKDLKTYYLGK